MLRSQRVWGVAAGSLCLTLVALSCASSGSGGSGAGGDGAGGQASAGQSAEGGAGAGGELPGDLGGAGAAGEGGITSLTPNGGEGGGGEGGEGGEADTAPYQAVDCAGQHLELNDQLVRYCVLLSSCSGAMVDVQSCVSSAGKHPLYVPYSGSIPAPQSKRPDPLGFPLEACPIDIDSCDDVLACAGSRVPLGECDANQTARCEGQLAINCGSDGRVTDCERQTGKTSSCEVVGVGSSARARCVVEPTCAVEGSSSCQGDMRVTCSGGKADGLDCSRFGEICEEKSGLEAYCAPPLPVETCDAPASTYCDGDLPVFCSSDSKRFTGPACSGTGDLVCGDAWGMAEEAIGCYAANPACDANFEDTSRECIGDDLEYRSDSYNLRVHCPAYGLATCRDDACAN